MNHIPAYKVVYNTIKQSIRDGVYTPGMLLPTETELEKEFSVSRTTIRRAIGLLSAEAFVKVGQGIGTIVQDVFTTQKLNCITSITETLKAKGHVVTTRGMLIERINAPDFVTEALKLSPGSNVFMIQRVQCADKVPIALMVNYLKENVVPDIDKYEGEFTSLYAFLEEHYGLIFKDASETLSAVSATFMESQVLQVPTGAPLLCSKRVSNTAQGPFEYSITKLVAEKYEYNVFLSGRG